MKITRIILVLSLFIQSVQGKVAIAFFKVYKPDGKILQLEKDGVFSHVAISIEKGWLHAYPKKGVELIKNFDDIAFKKFDVEILDNKSLNIPIASYQKYYGLPYDDKYSWDDSKIYCSELVAKILKFQPSPMSFDSNIWGKEHQGKGEMGISPDEIYDEALKHGFRKVN